MNTSGSTKGRTPDPALIDSMAMRYRHDFGLLTEQQQNSVRRKMIQLWEEVVGLGFYKQPSEPDGNGWTCVTERLPTEDELKVGVLFGIHWPEGRIEMVSWDMEYQHDYEMMCRHFEVFQPDRSSGTGYWRTSASIAPPRSGLTKAGK